MKILQVNALAQHGSTGRIVAQLKLGLRERGHAVHVVYSEGSGGTDDYRMGSLAEKKAHALLSRLSGRQAYFSPLGTRSLIRYIAEHSPDVVHLHNLHANFVHMPMLLAYLAANDIATVVTLHDCWFYTGKCCHYTIAGCDRWRTGCGECPQLAEGNPSWFIDATAQVWSDKRRLFSAIPRLAVIGVSDWIRSEAEASLLSCASAVERIYNWVDMEEFAPTMDLHRDSGPGSTEPLRLLAVASSWSDAKGLADMLKLARTHEEHSLVPGSVGRRLADAVVMIVGELPKGLDLPSNIVALGSVKDPHQLAEVYRSADMLLQLSREESFGKVVAESLACGTPAVAYRATASPELVGAGCGQVAEVGDLEGVLAAVVSLAGEDRVSIARRCRDHALENFAMDELIDETVSVYEALARMGQAG